jgi:hypothetical protein
MNSKFFKDLSLILIHVKYRNAVELIPLGNLIRIPTVSFSTGFPKDPLLILSRVLKGF